jgi:hypothetical protein
MSDICDENKKNYLYKFTIYCNIKNRNELLTFLLSYPLVFRIKVVVFRNCAKTQIKFNKKLLYS